MEKTASKKLENVYIYDGEAYFSSILPRTESTPPLTPNNPNFRLIILDKYSATAHEFDWLEKDGSDRNFKYGDGCIDRNIVPPEVQHFLDEVIAIKFSIHHLCNARKLFDSIENTDAKREFSEIFSHFHNADGKEKLNFALKGLDFVALTFRNVNTAISDEFSNASDVISEVLSEI